MSNDTPLSFNFDDDVKSVEIPITFQNTKYILTDASGDAIAQWRNANIKSTKISPDTGKVISMEGAANGETLLVSLCLYLADENGKLPMRDGLPDTHKLVPIQIIRSWTYRVVGKLYETIKRVSELDVADDTIESLEKEKKAIEEKISKKKKEDAAKNEQSDITVG